MARLRYTPKAISDISVLTEFSVNQFGPATARDYLAGVEDAIERLVHNPESGPVFYGVKPVIRSLVFRSHRIFYRFDGSEVLIVRVLHHAMDAVRQLKI